MKPILFDGHFGWLHLPQHAANRGVVLCKAPGHEAQWLHRSLLALAQQLSGAGVATLIFDYLGTGDAQDDGAARPDHECWLSGIERAARYLREIAQVEHVTLGGIRMGATLAMLAAPRCGADGLILIAPLLSGRAYLREARFTQKLWLEGVPDAVRATASSVDGLELLGYHIDAATLSWLDTLDLRQSEPGVARIAIAHPHAAECDALVQRYRLAGAQVESMALPGYTGMLRPAWASTAPLDTLTQLANWAAQAAPTRTVKAPDPAHTAAGDVMLVLPYGCEQTVEVGPRRLFGMLSQPQSDCALRSVEHLAARHAYAVSRMCRLVVLIVNTGGTGHVGEGRFGVKLARHLAQRGYASLRLDLSGLGDTVSGQESQAPVEFSTMQDDVTAAIDWLVGQGYTDVVLFGICSGAYLSLQAAQHPGVAGLLGINPPAPVLPRGITSLRRLGELDEGSTSAHLHALFKWHKWRDVARGRLRLMPVLFSVFSHAWGRVWGWLEPWGGGIVFGATGHRTTRTLLRTLDERGVRIRLVFSPQDVGLERLMMAIGSLRNLRKLRHMRVDVQAGVDHEVLSASAAATVIQQCERLLAELLVLAAVRAITPDMAPSRHVRADLWQELSPLPWQSVPEGASATDLRTRK